MRRETFTLSAKELQRVAVISRCVKGDLACARAAELHEVRNDDPWSIEEQLAGGRRPTQFGRALQQLGVTYIPANFPEPRVGSNVPWACSRIGSSANRV
jgi:hypothetical protein